MALFDFLNRPLVTYTRSTEKPMAPPPLTDEQAAVLRDKFAAAALEGLLARGLYGIPGIETMAFSIANQMMRTRKTL